MPGYFFDAPDRRAALKAELESWLAGKGTPYRHWSGVKGRGADCVHFAVRVYETLGATPGPIKIPRYDADWHLHNDAELLLDAVRACGWFDETGIDRPADGDLILFKFGRTESHCAIFFDGNLYQAVSGIGVQRISWHDPLWFKRRRHGFRAWAR